MPINFLLFYYMNLISLNSSEGEGVADPPPPLQRFTHELDYEMDIKYGVIFAIKSKYHKMEPCKKNYLLLINK